MRENANPFERKFPKFRLGNLFKYPQGRSRIARTLTEDRGRSLQLRGGRLRGLHHQLKVLLEISERLQLGRELLLPFREDRQRIPLHFLKSSEVHLWKV